VTPETKQRILDVLTARWEGSLLALRAQEREQLMTMLPTMERTITALAASREVQAGQVAKIHAHLTPKHS
jgi:hypothetical protein